MKMSTKVPECISEYVIREVSAATFASIANFLDDACPGENIDATLFRAAHVISFLRTKQDRPLLTTFLSTNQDRVYKIVKEADTETLIDAIYAFADGFSRKQLTEAFDYLDAEFTILSKKNENAEKKD
jgi:hypothetical protein